MFNTEFTEEEYQNIIKNFNLERGNLSQRLNKVLEKFYEEFPMRLRDGMDDLIIMAFINPITRNDAHDKFVEKEKKYYWISKDGTKSGKMHRRLYKDGFSKIHDIYIEDRYPKSENEELTESEIMSSIYNPIMFDKEEV